MALNITYLTTKTKFKTGTNLKANALNEAFEQPIKLTNSLSLALASFALADTQVDISTISQTELTSIYKDAFKDILRYKAPNTSNIAGITFEQDGSKNPILKMSSSNATKTTTFEMTPSVIKIYSTSGSTSTSPIEINPTEGKITAIVFDGVASKIKLVSSSSSNYFNVWFGKDNVLYDSDKVQFNPSTGTLRINGSIDFYGTKISASGFEGTTAYAEKLKVTLAPSTNTDYHVLFADDHGTTYFSDDFTYNPVDNVLSASSFYGIARRTNLLKITQSSDSNSKYYFSLLKTLPTSGSEYKEVYYNPYVYIEGNAIYALGGFKGTASSALRASSIDVTEDTSTNLYYVPFTDINDGSTGYDGKLKYNSNLKYKPSTNTLYANVTGSSTTATSFSSPKTINITGMFTGSTSTYFSTTTNLEVSYRSNYGLYSDFVLKQNTSAGVINIGNSSCKFIAIISIYNGGLGGQTLTFNYNNKSLLYSSVYAHSSSDFFMLRKVSSTSSKWYLVYGRTEAEVKKSTTACTDYIGSVVVYRYE